MRLAAIDIGTNSIHMIIVQVRPDFAFEVIDREKEMVRLGAGGLDGRNLTDTAMLAGLQTLSKFKRLAESHGVDEVIAAATSAVRESENGGDFLAEVHRQLGIQARVISGVEEARLIHLAAAYGVAIGEGTAVTIDIGGGSVEVTSGTASAIRHARSFKLGVIRLTERFVASDPMDERNERRMVKHINKETGQYIDRLRAAGYDRVVGTSGTILSLGALAADGDRPPGPDELRNRRVPAKAIHRLRKRLVGLTLEERLALPGLDPRRADLAVGGAILLDTLLARLKAPELTLCDLALREGLVLDYIRSNRARITRVDRYPDVRRRSVLELAERCNYVPDHAQQIARLATSLFDQTRPVHGLGTREREWLEYAAILHDIGVHISYGRHHRHSYYLVKNGDLRGFEPAEVEIIALLTRYHRRPPKKSHAEYRALDAPARKAVKVLSAFLRLAEGLDRSHAQLVARLSLHQAGDEHILRIEAAGDVELELWAAQRHVRSLERLFGGPLRFDVHEAARAPAEPAAATARRGRGRQRTPRTTASSA